MDFHPISFTKAHPVAVIVSMAVGYMVVPWLLGLAGGVTGVRVRLPQYGGSGG
jgi:hypothetical protein